MKANYKTPFTKWSLLAFFLLVLTIPILSCTAAIAEMPYFNGEAYEFDFEQYDYACEIILDDPIYFMDFEDEDAVVTPDGSFSAAIEPVFADEPASVEMLTPVEAEMPAAPTPRPPRKEPMLYDIPKEVLAADEKFAALIEEATKYIGLPYVWGGHCPETSFDCSGFVSYVYTFSGVYKTGGRGATGLHSLCQEVTPEEARPGDLVFFQGTMGADVPGITHVGIYVGNNMMLHCGNPIGYADLTEPIWQARFFAYGRLPY